MKRKLITVMLATTLIAGTALTVCGNSAPAESPAEAPTEALATEEAKPAATEEAAAKTEESTVDRPGAMWIDSGIYGTFEGRGEISLKDDYAAAINRDWAEKVKIREGAENVSARTLQTDNFTAAKIAVLTGEKTDDQDLTTLQNYYALLTDWDTRNQEGLAPLKPYVEDLMSISSVKEMTKYYSDPERNLYGNPVLKITFTTEPQDPFYNMLNILSQIMLGDETEDFQEGGKESPALSRKRQTAEYMLKRLGYSESDAKAIFDTAKGFEQNFLTTVEGIDPTADYTVNLPVSEFEERYKNIPYADILRSLGYDIDFKGKVSIQYPQLLDSFNENYTDENIEGIKAWTLVNTLLEFTKYGDRETYEETAKINGTKIIEDPEAYAIDVMQTTVPSMLDQMYVNYCFDKSIKPKVTELTDMMLDAYRKMIMEEDWISDETKAGAIEKIDNFKLNICYPDKVYGAKCTPIKSAAEGETALDAIIKGRRFSRLWEQAMLSHRNDEGYMRYDVYYSTLGACYLQQDNSVNIFAGICGGDYYDPDAPFEKNLGGLCMIVGHEITHAFDSEGADYDKDGALKNWWTEEDKAAFQKRVDKLVKYYSDLVPMPQVSDTPYGEEGARHVQKEAIGDLGALKCLLSIAKEQKDFDYDMFFKQIAIIQKEARYEEAEKEYVATEEHPVEAYRANIPLQNYDDFLNFYDIKEGDGMYLAPEDRIAVW